MRKIQIILLQIIVTNFIYGAYLNLSLIDNSEFTAIINNISYNRLTNVIEVDNLRGGSHYIKAMKPTSPDNEWNTTIYEGYINIPENYNIYASIDEKGNLIIYKRYYGNRIDPDKNYYRDRCNCDCEICIYCKNKVFPDHERKYECEYRIMKKNDFEDFKRIIKEQSFESTKKDIVLSVINKNYFKTEQVKEILNYFNFESTKLEVAKYAYNRTCDKRNYFKLYDVFSFESSIQELEDYIKNY